MLQVNVTITRVLQMPPTAIKTHHLHVLILGVPTTWWPNMCPFLCLFSTLTTKTFKPSYDIIMTCRNESSLPYSFPWKLELSLSTQANLNLQVASSKLPINIPTIARKRTSGLTVSKHPILSVMGWFCIFSVKLTMASDSPILWPASIYGNVLWSILHFTGKTNTRPQQGITLFITKLELFILLSDFHRFLLK